MKPKYTTFPIEIGEHFILVLIWKKEKDFREVVSSTIDAYYLQAHVTSDDESISCHPYLGSVNFYSKATQVGIVAHELTHVALHYVELNHKEGDEELLCTVQQALNRNFWNAVQNDPLASEWIYGDELAGKNPEESKPIEGNPGPLVLRTTPVEQKTIGQLMDELSIMNIRIWHLIDQVKAGDTELGPKVQEYNDMRNEYVRAIDKLSGQRDIGKKVYGV